MGFLTEKYSRIIKAPYYMYFKESLEIKAIVKGLQHLYNMIYDVLPREVEVEHRIKRSLRDQKAVVEEALRIAEKEKKLAVNVEVQETQALDIIRRIENEWKRVRDIISREKRMEVAKELRNIDQTFRYMLEQAMKEAEGEDKAVYNDIMNLLRAGEKGDRNMMQQMKTYFKKLKPSQLTRWAGKFEARGVRRYAKELEGERGEADRIINELDELLSGKGIKNGEDKDTFVRKNFDIIVKRLHDLIVALRISVTEEFKKAYQVTKRDIMLCFVLLNQLDDMKDSIKKWVREKKEPAAPEKEIYDKILKAEEKVAKHARVIAQGLRIIFHKEQSLERF